MNKNEIEKPLTTKEAADFLSCAVGTLYNRMSKKEIPYSKPGGKSAYFKMQDLVDYINRKPGEGK